MAQAILTNLGGLENSGVNSVLLYGDILQSVVGTKYDIVAFDPRGIGSSIPLANCSAAPASSRRSTELSGPDFTPSFYNNTLSSVLQLAQACQTVIGGENEAGPHMTTTVNARDMISISNAVSRTTEGKSIPSPELVNYWVFSYGTYIGEVLHLYFWTASGDWSSMESLMLILGQQCSFCYFAGSTACAFYTGNSAKDVQQRFEKILSAFDGRLAETRNQTNARIFEMYLKQIKPLLFQSTYYPISFFPILSDALILFEAATANLTIETLVNIGTPIQDDLANVKHVLVTQPALPEWFPAVYCSDGDAAAYGETLEEFQPYIETMRNQSMMAGDLWASQRVECSVWSIRSNDRFQGPFGGRTKTPILFVSNTLDPATPLFNGQKSAAKYTRAALLIIEGVGHSSLGTINKCAFSKIATHFQTGVLPAPKIVCSVEKGAFGVTLPSK